MTVFPFHWYLDMEKNAWRFGGEELGACRWRLLNLNQPEEGGEKEPGDGSCLCLVS